MNKKLVIVTTDMEIELAMFVDIKKLALTRQAIAEARNKYYREECLEKLFDDTLFETMSKYGIDFEYIPHEKI